LKIGEVNGNSTDKADPTKQELNLSTNVMELALITGDLIKMI
jgi:Zn-dependent membrane protease YugP